MDKKLYDKRKKPDCKKEQQRKEIFSTYSELCPQKPQDNRLSGLETGNKKTGKSGRIYDKILVWNIPPRITCPGVSDWCSTHCYNADARKDVYTIDRWCENLWDFHFRLPELKDKIENQINETTGRCAVRLHSSRDFFSEEYIDFWKEIILEFPKVSFWGYTRTWNVPCLKDNVNELMNLNNMQLFASYDTTMATSVPAIPKSLVFDTRENLFEYAVKHTDSIICPEQYGRVESCADCGLCINRIEEFYGSRKESAWLTARPEFRLQNVTRDEFARYINELSERGISFNYTLNTSYLGNKEQIIKREEEIQEYISFLIEAGVKTITVSLPYMAEIIRRVSDKIGIEVSTIAHLDSLTQIKIWQELYGITKICIGLNKNRDINFLSAAARYCNEHDIVLTLLANEFCGNGISESDEIKGATGCIFRDHCYQLHSAGYQKKNKIT